MSGTLERHRDIWEKKKILRVIYTEWYQKILGDLSRGKGKTVELGAGSGNFKEFKPDVISSDIEPCDWLDMSFDAHKMPFEDDSVANIVMVDVLHHLFNPRIFLKEAGRVLKRRGRILIVEPFPSPFSLLIYRKFHPEPFLFNVDYFKKKGIEGKDPWDSNQAIAYLLFFKNKLKFQKLFGAKLRIVKKERMSCVLYPASGGFENKALIPDYLIPAFKFLEFILIPLRRLLAFRCYIVLEKIG
jgi:SAM-dependent methyltransferase